MADTGGTTTTHGLTRAELYVVVGLIVAAFLLLSYHEHNARVAQEALLQEHERQTKVDTQAAQAQLALLQQQVAAQQKQADAQFQQGQQLVATLAGLSSQLAGLRQQEAQHQADVQAMPVDKLVAALLQQFGPGLAYNQQTGTVTGVTSDTLRKVEEQTVQLKDCTAENANLTTQIATSTQRCGTLAKAYDTEHSIVAELRQSADTNKKSYEEQLATLREQVKVVRGTFAQRLWNRVKFPLGVLLGVAVGHAI